MKANRIAGKENKNKGTEKEQAQTISVVAGDALTASNYCSTS